MAEPRGAGPARGHPLQASLGCTRWSGRKACVLPGARTHGWFDRWAAKGHQARPSGCGGWDGLLPGLVSGWAHTAGRSNCGGLPLGFRGQYPSEACGCKLAPPSEWGLPDRVPQAGAEMTVPFPKFWRPEVGSQGAGWEIQFLAEPPFLGGRRQPCRPHWVWGPLLHTNPTMWPHVSLTTSLRPTAWHRCTA